MKWSKLYNLKYRAFDNHQKAIKDCKPIDISSTVLFGIAAVSFFTPSFDFRSILKDEIVEQMDANNKSFKCVLEERELKWRFHYFREPYLWNFKFGYYPYLDME